jgi:hypothetical protein
MRRGDARSAQIGGPNLISHLFHFSPYIGEPIPSVRARNLLSKEDWRTALRDESFEHWPQVPLIGCALPFPRLGERLAGAAPCPDRPFVRPRCQPQRFCPTGNAGEKMTLPVSPKLGCTHVVNGSLVHPSSRDPSFSDESPDVVTRFFIDVVVVVHLVASSLRQ